MAIIVRCTEDIEETLRSLTVSMENNSKQADSLSKRIFWLNVVLAIAAVSTVAVEVYKIIHKIS
jgi:hypothetical protein